LNKEKKFTEMHNEYVAEWDHAMKTGDTSALEKRMPPDYYVTFFSGDAAKPETFDRAEAVEGMRQSVQDILGAEKMFDNRIIQMRNAENAVVFFEQVIKKDEQELSRLFTIENWRYRDGEWELGREVEEHI